jgi:hypothetical protein
MKFTWTVEGDDPDYAHAERYGINGFYSPMPSKDPLSNRVIRETIARGRIAGMYYGAAWFPALTGKQLAEKMNKDYLTFEPALRKKIRVMFNEEDHNPGKVIDCLERWRVLQPTANTSWSMEPKQGGWMGLDVTKMGQRQSDFVTRVLKAKVRLVPQLFFGGMAPAGEDDVMWDLACRGFPASILSPFYDAADLPDDWDGFAFTIGRLP